MARLVYPSFIKTGHGRMEDVILSSYRGVPYMKPYRKKRDTSTPGQVEVRNAFTAMVGNWKWITGIMRVAWDRSIGNRPLTGYNSFIGTNVNRYRAGQALVVSVPMGEDPLLNLAAEAGTSGEIRCSFLPAPAGRHVTFFAHRQSDGEDQGAVSRHDAGADPASPFVIPGMVPGRRYYVYAVVTDRAYNEATSVSASSGVAVTAGA